MGKREGWTEFDSTVNHDRVTPSPTHCTHHLDTYMLPWPAPCSSPVRLPFLCGLLPPQGQTETDSCTRSGKGGRGGEGMVDEGVPMYTQ